ncbi:hypothetical protein R5R35_006551 [Gryllus longicercus]|uniref:peptidylprolyl isomerase n=1 Tax=Gryllus longicercus TaxID=2509291 RepID=A0AAN9V975_9ORTH|nr:Peptidyl-prolyl cis-trans isomerase [Gryllus bimaculatus]
MDNAGNPLVYMDIQIGDERVGRIIIELYKNVAPKTAENFRALCTGEKGVGQHGKPLHYKGCFFHRILPSCMIQGGDIINYDGSSGESIYGGCFDDENFEILHFETGIVSMANAGPNTNSSQFVITLNHCPQLNNVNVAFGKVIKGYGVVNELGSTEMENDIPLKACFIADCGEILPGKSLGLEENDGTDDTVPPFPEDWDIDVNTVQCDYLEDIITKIKNAGNYFYDSLKYTDADHKYRKALRYVNWVRNLGDQEKLNKMLMTHQTELQCLLNLAAVKLQTDVYRDAVNYCNMALAIDGKNAKALYRRAQAKRALGDYDAALDDLRTALQIAPSNKSIVSEMNLVKQFIQRYHAKEKKVFEKMFK